ncbi:MAG: transposase [Oscillospiraceae bacterium]|nr:transposase [Oscillospiraceae bacterium]
MRVEKIGIITKAVIEILKLDIKENSPIFVSDGNYKHMCDKHPKDFEKYYMHIPEIIRVPNYVGINPKDSSLEYVKEFKINDEFVKVAIRVSGHGIFFMRSMYMFEDAIKFIKKGRLKKID